MSAAVVASSAELVLLGHDRLHSKKGVNSAHWMHLMYQYDHPRYNISITTPSGMGDSESKTEDRIPPDLSQARVALMSAAESSQQFRASAGVGWTQWGAPVHHLPVCSSPLVFLFRA